MANTQKFGAEARALILDGMTTLNNAVKVTMGPAGRNVLFRHGYAVISTKDGVTVAREINLAGVYESIGADLIKQAAGQTVDEAGDGTTTATLLAHAIFETGCKAIENGAEPVQLVKGIKAAVTAIVGDYDLTARKYQGGILESMSVPCSPELAFNAAKISANGDDAIADVVSRAVLKVGVDGALTIGESFSQEHILEVVEGLQVQSGYANPYFITDMARNRVAYDDVTVLLLDKRVSTADEATNIMTAAIKAAKAKGRAVSILVICNDIDPEALNHILSNKMKPQSPIPIVVVRTPLWGEARRDLLEDIAVVTGAKRVEGPRGKAMEELKHADFGYAQRVVVTQNSTVISSPAKDDDRTARIDPYLAGLKAITEDLSLRADQIDAAKGRLAALMGGVAVIKVGGTSPNSITETKFRVEDAIHACRAAVREGVVAGGGSALLAAKLAFQGTGLYEGSAATLAGINLTLHCLARPAAQIAMNAGHEADDVIGRLLGMMTETGKDSDYRSGFNASTGAFMDDMIAAGIVDPLRVVRAALNAAASAAAVCLLTEVVIGYDAANTPPQLPNR